MGGVVSFHRAGGRDHLRSPGDDSTRPVDVGRFGQGPAREFRHGFGAAGSVARHPGMAFYPVTLSVSMGRSSDLFRRHLRRGEALAARLCLGRRGAGNRGLDLPRQRFRCA